MGGEGRRVNDDDVLCVPRVGTSVFHVLNQLLQHRHRTLLQWDKVDGGGDKGGRGSKVDTHSRR